MEQKSHECKCEAWDVSAKQIESAQMIAFQHGQNYTGLRFKFCPWCGKFLKPVYLQYEHHGALVWVRADLKGRHRDLCLCYSCSWFEPNESHNCPIAQENYELCVKHNLVLPVFECPKFEEMNNGLDS